MIHSLMAFMNLTLKARTKSRCQEDVNGSQVARRGLELRKWTTERTESYMQIARRTTFRQYHT